LTLKNPGKQRSVLGSCETETAHPKSHTLIFEPWGKGRKGGKKQTLEQKGAQIKEEKTKEKRQAIPPFHGFKRD